MAFTVIPAAVAKAVDRGWLHSFLVWLDTTLATILGGQPALEVDAVATSALAANTYANGALGVGRTLTGNANGAFATIDGVAPVLNKTYLIAGEAAPANNGPYKLTQLGDAGTPYILTGVVGMDQSAEFKDGTIIGVRGGTLNADTTWKYTGQDSPTLGVTGLTFVRNPGTVTDNTAQTITGAKTFASAMLLLRNAADTFSATFTFLGTAARAIVFPDKAGTVSIDDEGTTQRVTTVIANAALKTLNATPVTAVPAPAAGFYNELVSVHARIVFAGAAFDAVGATDFLELRYTNAAGLLLTQNVNPVGFADQASTQSRLVPLANATAAFLTPAAAAAIVAHIATGEWFGAAGGGELHLDILFRTRTLAV